MYAWIKRHTQVVQSPISNYCLKVMFDYHIEPQLVPKLLLQVSVRELYKRLVSDPIDGGIKDARDEDDNIIISDSNFRSLLPPQLKHMSARYKVMCGCECCISDKSIHSSLISWRDRYLEKRKYQIQNAQSRRSGEKLHHIYETYKIQSFHMGVIFMSKHLIWHKLQCAHILSLLMYFHTGNVYFGAVLTVHV